MQTIKHLPKSVHSSLRSSIVLSDIPRVVEELVYNSIDANAKKVDISVNIRACFLKVEDDGCGITRDELVLLGEKYATSKFHDAMGEMEPSYTSFGINGEALASLSDISVVEVRTKACGRPNSYCKIIKGSKYSHLGIDDQREVVGTTVVVRELFYNQPVRRKQMQSSHKRELHRVKKCVLRIALIHPQILFRLFDIDSEDELLCTVPSSSPLPLISNSFGNDVSSCLHEITTSDQNWILSGHITGPADVFCNKDFQYLYINSRLVSRSPIHKMINNLAASFRSSMLRRNEEIDAQSQKRQKPDVYPAYLLNLCCPRSSYDLHFEPSKTTVEFKDWQSILLFFEQSITNYWKKHVSQSSKDNTIDGATCVPLQSDVAVKLNESLLKHHNVQTKEDVADLYESSLQKNVIRDSNTDMCASALPKNLHCFSLDVEPSTWHIYYPDCMNRELQFADNVLGNKRKLGHKQMCSPEGDSYHWLEDVPSQLEDSDLFGARPTVWKKQRTEGIFHGCSYSSKFGMLEDVKTKCLLADGQDSEIIGPDIELQEACSTFLSRPNRTTTNFLQNQTSIKSTTSGLDGFYVEFDKSNEDCLLNEDTERIVDISCPEISHLSGRLYHEDCSTSRSFSVTENWSTRRRLGTATGYVEGLESNTIAQMNCPDIQAVWAGDYMDDSSKGSFLHLHQPFLLIETPHNHSHARTDLEVCGRTNKSFDWSCENIDSNFRFSLDRLNSDSSIICEGTKCFNKFDIESHLPNYFNHDNFSVDLFVCEDDQIPRKSKINSRLSCNISPDNSATGCQLDVRSSQMASDKMVIEDVLNQHNFGCNKKCRLSKGRSRSRSAPPFYKGKRKFLRLNEHLSRLTGGGDNEMFNKNLEDPTPEQEDVSHANATQPIPETSCSEFSDPHISVKANTKMCEEARSVKTEDCTVRITKWRDDSCQHTVLEIPNGPFECYDDVLSIFSGPLHLSSSSLVPECIDKNCFEEARVLLQLDKKFIPIISGETLLLVDQHAADERIRLEELRSKVLSDEGRGIAYLDSEEDLTLPETGFQLFQKYNEQILKWGWIINISSSSSQSFKKNMNILRRQARTVALSALPCILGVNLTGKDLMDFIQQLDETEGSSAIPPAVLRVLNFKACRGAIMFGDPLLPSECCLIIEELKSTSLCFQCAHGRPTTVPIVNVASLRDELARLELMSGRQGDTWHGLSHYVPSLERARARLKRLRKLRCGL